MWFWVALDMPAQSHLYSCRCPRYRPRSIPRNAESRGTHMITKQHLDIVTFAPHAKCHLSIFFGSLFLSLCFKVVRFGSCDSRCPRHSTNAYLGKISEHVTRYKPHSDVSTGPPSYKYCCIRHDVVIVVSTIVRTKSFQIRDRRNI